MRAIQGCRCDPKHRQGTWRCSLTLGCAPSPVMLRNGGALSFGAGPPRQVVPQPRVSGLRVCRGLRAANSEGNHMCEVLQHCIVRPRQQYHSRGMQHRKEIAMLCVQESRQHVGKHVGKQDLLSACRIPACQAWAASAPQGGATAAYTTANSHPAHLCTLAPLVPPLDQCYMSWALCSCTVMNRPRSTRSPT